MSKYPKSCKGCKFLSPIYGNKDKSGKRIVSSYWCSKKNGKVDNRTGKCNLRTDERSETDER